MDHQRPLFTPVLDEIDRQLLTILETDGRATLASLGRAVGLSAPAIADRLKRMEATGLIGGYKAVVTAAAMGWTITAYVAIRAFPGKDAAIETFARSRAEVRECHEVTGDDSYLLRICARDVKHLDRVITDLAPLGATRSTLVLSSPVAAKPVIPTDPLT